MKNLNKTIYGKILVQAEEAKELGFEKLASNVLAVVGPVARDEKEKLVYSSSELHKDLQNKLWKVAMDFIAYHDLQSVDIQKIDDTISDLTKVVAQEMEQALDVTRKVGPLEPKLPGESE